MAGGRENLKPWPKGQSGNPGGRKKGIELQLRELMGDDLQRIALAMRDIALGRSPEGSGIEIKGSDCTKAAEWIYNRCYGLPKQLIEIDDGTPKSSIDWAKVPLERRRELLKSLLEIDALDTSDGGSSEH